MGEEKQSEAFVVLGLEHTNRCQPWTSTDGMYDITVLTDQYSPHQRLPASGLENSCNATLLLLDGSQIVALGRQTIGEQSPCLLMHSSQNLPFLSN